MPMSLKCMISKWLYKGQISQEEYDAVMKKLDGHDAEIKGQTIRDILETVKEQNEIYLAEREKQIRADERAKVIDNLFQTDHLYNDVYSYTIDELVKLKEQKNDNSIT